MSPIGGNGQIHNYCILFAVNSVVAFVCTVWALFFIDEEKDMIQFFSTLGSEDDKLILEKNLKAIADQETKHPMLLLFDLSNIKQMLATYVKPRPGRVRIQIVLVTLALFCNWFALFGPMTFQFQFTEKVYKWTATTYNYVTSFGQIISSVVIMCISPLLIKVSVILCVIMLISY